MKLLRIADEAQHEIRAAITWYESERSGLGGQFWDELQTALSLLRERPHIGRLVPRSRSEPRPRRWPLRRFPFFVIYREFIADLEVVAVAHQSRKPGYWARRLAR